MSNKVAYSEDDIKNKFIELEINPAYDSFWNLPVDQQKLLVKTFCYKKNGKVSWTCCGSGSKVHVDKTKVIIAAKCRFIKNDGEEIHTSRILSVRTKFTVEVEEDVKKEAKVNITKVDTPRDDSVLLAIVKKQQEQIDKLVETLTNMALGGEKKNPVPVFTLDVGIPNKKRGVELMDTLPQ